MKRSVLTPPSNDSQQPGLIVEDETEAGASRDHIGRRTLADPRLGATLSLVALVLVAITVAAMNPPGMLSGMPSARPSPTVSSSDSSGLPSEAEVWGAIWSNANGARVLRPTWLPKSDDEYQVHTDLGATRGSDFHYRVSYIELHSVPGSTVWSIEFLADRLGGSMPSLQQFTGAAEDLKIRGHAATLFGTGSPGWTLTWTEDDYRYAIQAFRVTREELLRIADSLALVIDAGGRTPGSR